LKGSEAAAEFRHRVQAGFFRLYLIRIQRFLHLHFVSREMLIGTLSVGIQLFACSAIEWEDLRTLRPQRKPFPVVGKRIHRRSMRIPAISFVFFRFLSTRAAL